MSEHVNAAEQGSEPTVEGGESAIESEYYLFAVGADIRLNANELQDE